MRHPLHKVRHEGAISEGIRVAGQLACKPGSVPVGRYRPAGDDHSSGTPIAGRLVQPTRTVRLEIAPADRFPGSARAVPIWFCSRWGLPCRTCCQVRGALLPHPFTLAPPVAGRFAFCGTFPGVAPAGRYPAPYFHGARTFLCHHDRSPKTRRESSGHPASWQSQIRGAEATESSGRGILACATAHHTARYLSRVFACATAAGVAAT